MDYAIVTKEWMTQRGLIIEPHMRTSVDNNKVVLHKSWLRPFLEDEGIELYYHDDPAFIALLASAEWTSPEGEIEPVSMGEGTKESPYTYDGVMSLVRVTITHKMELHIYVQEVFMKKTALLLKI